MLLLSSCVAWAGVLSGEQVQVHYGTEGLWNAEADAAGFQVRSDPAAPWIDLTWPHAPWSSFSIAHDGANPAVYTVTTDPTPDTVVVNSAQLTTVSDQEAYQVHWSAGPLDIVRTEIVEGAGVSVHLVVQNVGAVDLPNVRLALGVATAPDVATVGVGVCEEAGCAEQESVDAVDTDGDGTLDLALSSAAISGLSLGFGTCSVGQTVGHTEANSDPDAFLVDLDGLVADRSLHWGAQHGALQPGETWTTSFTVAFGVDAAAATEARALSAACVMADKDADGHPDPELGGADCDDADPLAYPGADEVPNDDVDQDCDGADWRPISCFEDADLDGFGTLATVLSEDDDCADPGESEVDSDCDDAASSTWPGAPELGGDGIDQDCDGIDAPSPTEDDDSDGLTNGDEVSIWGTDPFRADTDFDGLDDGEEVILFGSDPNRADTDRDGLIDAHEVRESGTDPLNPDTDGDGLEDGEELTTDPLSLDTDDDGLGDYDEVMWGITDPADADGDGDGLRDGVEIYDYGTDPLDSDSDDDTLNDGMEVMELGTDPLAVDTDGDGLDDGFELTVSGGRSCPSPHNPDSDADGLPDGLDGTVDGDGDGAVNACDPTELLGGIEDYQPLKGACATGSSGPVGGIALFGILLLLFKRSEQSSSDSILW